MKDRRESIYKEMIKRLGVIEFLGLCCLVSFEGIFHILFVIFLFLN